MRYFYLFALLAMPVFAADKPDVKAALSEWTKAVESAKVDSIVALYDNDAIMISAFVQKPITTHKALMSYYKKVVSNPDIKVNVTEQHPQLFGNIAVNSGQYTMSYTQEGEEIIVPGRFTFVYELQNGKWIIVDHHSSDVPKEIQTKD